MFNSAYFHPMLVHFPIALVTVGFFFELLSVVSKKESCFQKISFYLLIAGTLTAIASVFTGMTLTFPMQGAADQARSTHAFFALLTLIVLIITLILKLIILRKADDKPLWWIYFMLYGVAVLLVCSTGLVGANLVYNHLIAL